MVGVTMGGKDVSYIRQDNPTSDFYPTSDLRKFLKDKARTRFTDVSVKANFLKNNLKTYTPHSSKETYTTWVSAD